MTNPVTAALRARHNGLPPRQVANGPRADKAPGPQVASESFAAAVKQAWLPVLTGQPIPMVGERTNG